MKPSWYDSVGMGSLPDDLQQDAADFASTILNLLPRSKDDLPRDDKGRRDLAEKIGLECIKTQIAGNAGTDKYFPLWSGDRFTPDRHIAIHADYWQKKAAGTLVLQDFLHKWDITERLLRTIKSKGKDPNQIELFPEDE